MTGTTMGAMMMETAMEVRVMMMMMMMMMKVKMGVITCMTMTAIATVAGVQELHLHLWRVSSPWKQRWNWVGPPNSHYVIYHSKSATFAEAHRDKPRGKVVHLQAFSGINPTTLPKINRLNTSALYQVTLMKGQAGVTYIAGLSGVMKSAADAWTISMTDKRALQIVGPNGPCRYALFTNIPEDVHDPKERCFQKGCLATGDSETVEGGLIIDDDNLTIWVDYMTKVLVTCDGVTVQKVEGGKWMEQPDGRLAFQRGLTEKEKSPGLKVYRAFALRKDLNGADVSIELGGSPHQVIKQPPGVAYALNCGGPAYHALNGAVFVDTQTQFKPIETGGLDCMHKFSAHTAQDRNLHSLLSSTYDSFLFSSYNCTHDGFNDKIKFPLPLSGGDYTMRLYTVGGWMTKGYIHYDSTELTSQILDQLTSEDHIHAVGTTAKTCEVPIKVEKENTTLSFRTNGDDVCLSGILVYDKDFKEPTLTPEERQKETKIKQELADKLLPLNRTFSLKEMKIAGWSKNLLENASGENGDMSHWNISGDFKVDDNGDGTEKKFMTSYMECNKSQDVNLTQHFTDAHLDSAPEIQASESFHEGGCKGGFYSFTVSLLDASDNVIVKQTTGRKGSITTSGWIRESFTFKGYGPGVRTVCFESHGEDDKSWAGAFGAWISAGVLRVKSEISPASGDEYSDVETSTAEERKQGVTSFLRHLQEEHRDSLKFMLTSSEADKPGDEAAKDKQVKPEEVIQPMIIVKKKTVKREIRVFVSSTFRDFEEERELIIKKVFRELNRLCLDRGVFFTYVDLRWGITEQQSKGGRTIEICLREIDKCRPYFICMMGDRFGWSQSSKFKDELLDKSYDTVVDAYRQFKWVDDYRFNSSVTQLEVMYGAMRKHKEIKKERIFFYLRKPMVKREDLPPPVETEEDRKNVKGETQWHFDLQTKLRNSVAESGHTKRTYVSAVDAASMIKEDLIKCINEDFPPGTNLTALQRESEAHDAFANARRRVYIGRQEYFDYIDNYFAQKPEGPLTIIGESGSGKSALVANWCGRFEERNPGTFLFKHFIGSSAESASHVNLLRRLYGEMKQFYNLEMEIPTSDRNLIIDLPSWLNIASNRSKVMIVLDALNQLDSGAGGSGDEKSLTWLPQTLPNNVQMLLSTLPGETQDVIELSGWPMYKIQGLQENEKLDIITGYMDLYGKTLNKEQTDLIINAKQSSNPLYLKALLDEVRVYGDFFKLTPAIKSYLTAEDPGALFVKVLQRLENDFEKGAVCRPNLVRDTTTAIWCSHRGMSESELLTLLKIPSAVWSPFYLSLEDNLINRNGLLNFFHDHLRQAVERRYLPTDEDKRKKFVELSNFFNAQDIDDRYSDEVPYLLIQAKELTRLKATILNVNVFQFLMKTEDGNFQLIMAWRMLGGFEPVEQAYLDVLSKCEVNWEQDKDKVELIKFMAVFFMQLGLLTGARVLNERLLKEIELRYLAEHSTIVRHHFNYSMKLKCNHPTVIDVLIELGNVCLKQGNFKASEEYLEDALSRLTKVKTPQQKLQLVKAVITMVSVQRRQGDIDFAKKLLMRALGVSKEVVGHDHHYTAALLGMLGEILYDQSRLEEAVACHTFDFNETQREGGPEHPHIAAILNNIGLVQDDMNASGTQKTFSLALGILLEAYGKDHVDVATVRYNLGAQFFGNQMFQRAKYQFEEAYRVFKLFLGEHHTSTRVAKKAVDMVEDL
ncbi:TPR repeat-containing protein DDB_G0287407 [Strongylocentrotus purpuratus]|uniref:FBA domain-containing protein n=1 Tax=Strongylocentrotus purpuratus TaxID=7668 RepID=A0A7M7N6E0_STRPU|nr:TPR repeat-containing protein DDB_G0287407 [Strongylocentrotus purpuratus]